MLSQTISGKAEIKEEKKVKSILKGKMSKI